MKSKYHKNVSKIINNTRRKLLVLLKTGLRIEKAPILP